MGGILRSHLPAWHQITDNAWVLQCIQGYHLEFGDTLPQGNWPPKQPPLSPEQTQILDQEILSLLQKNAIESAPGREGFFSPMFTVPKKDGGWRPIINLKRLNTYLEVPHFKMEGINTLKDVLQKNDFMGKIDLKDAYLTVPVSPHHRKFLKFSMERTKLSIQVSPLWLSDSSTSLHQNSSTSGSEIEEAGYTYCHLPRRYFDYGSKQGSVKVSHESTRSRIGVLGVQAKPKQMCLDTDTDHRISGLSHQLSEDDNISTGRQTPQDKERMQTPLQQETCDCSGAGPLDRPTFVDDSSCERRPPPLPSTAEVTSQDFIDLSRKLRPSGRNHGGSEGRPHLVDGQTPTLQRSLSCPTLSRHDNHNRCFEVRMGCDRSGCEDRRSVDNGRKNCTHQFSGNEGGTVSSADVCLKEKQHSYPPADRQLHNNSLHKPQRWNSLESVVQSGTEHMGLVCKQTNLSTCRAHSRCDEFGSRCGIEEKIRAERLDAGSGSFPYTAQSMGSI